MKYSHHFIFLAAMSAASFVTLAQGIYENTDQQGVVEFSDQPSPDAKAINVRPNVVDAVPVKPIQSSSPASPGGAVEAPAVGVQPEVIHEGVVEEYESYGDNRATRRKAEEQLESGNEAVQQPVRKVLRPHAGDAGAVRR